MKLRTSLSVIAAMMLLGSGAHAQVFSVAITVDENGNGNLTNTAGANAPLPVSFQTDPGPGGLNNVLTYGLLNPPGLTAGDLFLQDDSGGILDVIRFNPDEQVGNSTGALVFYSDNIDNGGIDAKADTVSPPNAFYTNIFTIPEVGPEGNNGAFYTPVAGQPGFVAGAAGPVTYHIISDQTAVPEPGAYALLASLSLSGVGFFACRRKRTQKAT